LIEPWFIFSLIWSVGATCDNDGRVKFSEWLRTTMETANLKIKLPKEGYVYDYFVEDGGLFSAKEEDNAEEDEKVKKKVF
jgi:dynein heavy chain